jgi:hypothetical protein
MGAPGNDHRRNHGKDFPAFSRFPAFERHLHGRDRVGILNFDLDLWRRALFPVGTLQGNGVQAGVALLGQQVAVAVPVGTLVDPIEYHAACYRAEALKEFH